jgi:hypothetical protein
VRPELPALRRNRAAVAGPSFEDRGESQDVLALLREDRVVLPDDFGLLRDDLGWQREVLEESSGDRRRRDADRRQLEAVLGLFAKCLELQRKPRR